MSDITLNFSGRDFTTEYERLLTLLRQQLPTYTDLNYSDPGMVLISLLARETDQLNYYIDRVAQEGFLRTAVFKQSVIELGRLVDYLPTLASPAYTTLRLTRIQGVTGSITIPKYTSFERTDGVAYTTTEEVTLASGESYADVYAVQGSVHTEEVTTTTFTTTEWSNQHRYVLPQNTINALFEMYHLETVNISWSLSATFWRTTSDSRVFLLELNGDDTVNLVVGNGTFGSDFTDINKVYLRYLTTSGPDGNCGTGRVTVVPTEYDTYITCTNIELAAGGAYAESIDSIRTSIPAVTRTQRRGVTLEDYETLIEHIPGVRSCQALDRNTSVEWPHFHIPLYVIPNGGGPMPSMLKETIYNECEAWGHLGSWDGRYILKDAEEVTVDITASVGLSINTNQSTINTSIRNNLTALLAVDTQEIAGTLLFDDVFNAFMDVSGVANVTITSPSRDVTAPNGSILTLGTVTITYR